MGQGQGGRDIRGKVDGLRRLAWLRSLQVSEVLLNAFWLRRNDHGLPPLSEHLGPRFKTNPAQHDSLMGGFFMKPLLVFRNAKRKFAGTPDDAVFRAGDNQSKGLGHP